MLKPNGGLRGNSSSIIKTVIIDNSDALRAFDAVDIRNGDLEASAAAEAIFGIIISIVDKNDLPLSPEDTLLSDLGTATISKTVTPYAVTVAADNETVDLIAAKVDLSMESIYSGDIETAETMNTTVSSNKPGLYVALADQRTVDETTATRTIATAGQMFGWGVDPSDSGNMLVSIHESSFYSTAEVVD